MIALLDWLNAPFLWITSLSNVAAMSIISLIYCSVIIIWGLGLAKLRISPLWVLGIMIPYVQVIVIWILAYKKWPQKN